MVLYLSMKDYINVNIFILLSDRKNADTVAALTNGGIGVPVNGDAHS